MTIFGTRIGVYRHWKGDRYRVLFVAMMSTNGLDRTPQVIYVSLKTGEINVRNEAQFHEQVHCGEPWWPKTVARFTYESP